MSLEVVGREILIRGIVQGVGFRPFVYNLALQHHLTGWVRNSSRGVEIEVNGLEPAVEAFVTGLRTQAPPLARIDTFDVKVIPANGFQDFTIVESTPQPGEFLPVSPDVTICPDCARELFDPTDRRYRYPFINCTNCGPRFTIIQDIPYDRPNTTMSGFPMCPDCRKEYENPTNRRFHAQPIACPVCGPKIWLESNGKIIAEREDALQTARQWLRGGKILAIKGLGGVHLACDASNPHAVDELRRRKRRSDKAFALMAPDLATVAEHCFVSPEESNLLTARQAPIVLLNRKPGSTVVPAVAPNQNTLGVMLPYTPLHLLLMEKEPGFPEMLVMTSGNLSEEPIAYDDEDIRARLSGMADAYLMHDRPIHTRVDDSVVRVVSTGPMMVRRSRGYAPDPILLKESMPSILGAGAELKNTFCLTRDKYAFPSHHIGDLENFETYQSYETGIAHFERLFRIHPEMIACDLHPDYLATRYARQRAQEQNLPLVEVQHHHAHLAACLGENGWDNAEPAIGLSFDGTGLGTDGAIWGGEVLVGNARGYQRRFHLAYTPLPGGDQAVRKPARMALAALWCAGIEWSADLPPVKALTVEEQSILKAQLERKINTPLTSSMGRLFDAVSALLGVRQVINYEGQAAIEMEATCDPDEKGYYSFSISNDVIDVKPVLVSLIQDLRSGVSIPRLAARFHNSIAWLCLDLCRTIQQEQKIVAVAMSGGVWQNKFLFEHTDRLLKEQGFQMLHHKQLPPNDGCIGFGQVMVAAAQQKVG